MCVRVCVYIAIFALKFHEGYKPDYAASQRCPNSILLQRIWIIWASLMDICQTLIVLGLNFLLSSTVFRLASFSTLASPVNLRNLLASRKKNVKIGFQAHRNIKADAILLVLHAGSGVQLRPTFTKQPGSVVFPLHPGENRREVVFSCEAQGHPPPFYR